MSSDNTNPEYPPDHMKEIIIMTRLKLYNHNQRCGPAFIRQELKQQNIKPLPSLFLISRILKEYGLTHRRTGWY